MQSKSVLVLAGYSWRALLIHPSFTPFLSNSQILSFSLSFQSFISSLLSQKPLPFPSGWFLRTQHIIIVFNQCPSWLFSMSSTVLPRSFDAEAHYRPTWILRTFSRIFCTVGFWRTFLNMAKMLNWAESTFIVSQRHSQMNSVVNKININKKMCIKISYAVADFLLLQLQWASIC